MVRVKCEVLGDGLGPNEKIVRVPTMEGGEQVVVSLGSLLGDALEIGIVDERQERVLIELPQESVTGRWRLWVPSASVER